jgi:hypothetical protein
MAFAILRIQKITASKVGGANAHNTRTMEVPNSDSELRAYNTQLKGTDSLKNDIDNRLQEAGIDKTRSNAVLGIEHMMTASPEFFNYHKSEEGKLKGNVPAWQKFEKECMNWLKDQYGEKNIINVHVHKDEKTPHIHAIVSPILEKEISWKNGNEKGSKTENRLSARDFINGADKLQKMQDSFANHLQKSGLELDRGQKGSKATHTEIKDFYTHIKNANDFKIEKTDITIKIPKIQIEKPNRFENLDNYKTEQEQKVQDVVTKATEENHTIVLNALKPLHYISTKLLEESRLKSNLDSENKKLQTKLLYANSEIQKLKGENTELKTQNTKLKADVKTNYTSVIKWINYAHKHITNPQKGEKHEQNLKWIDEKMKKIQPIYDKIIKEEKAIKDALHPKKEEISKMTGEKKEVKTEQKKQEPPTTEPKKEKEVKTEQTISKPKKNKGMSM